MLAIFIKVQHFAYVKKLVVENMPKHAKFDKYAKPKIFMPTTSQKCQIKKNWHKNMLVGNAIFYSIYSSVNCTSATSYNCDATITFSCTTMNK